MNETTTARLSPSRGVLRADDAGLLDDDAIALEGVGNRFAERVGGLHDENLDAGGVAAEPDPSADDAGDLHPSVGVRFLHVFDGRSGHAAVSSAARAGA